MARPPGPPDHNLSTEYERNSGALHPPSVNEMEETGREEAAREGEFHRRSTLTDADDTAGLDQPKDRT